MTPARISNSRAEAPGGGGEGGCGAVTGAVAGGGYRRVAGPRGAGWARLSCLPIARTTSADSLGPSSRAEKGYITCKEMASVCKVLGEDLDEDEVISEPEPEPEPDPDPEPEPEPELEP